MDDETRDSLLVLGFVLGLALIFACAILGGHS